ncbi:MAG: PEP-CTERM sorting domain-containing protein [Thermodesulfobacteriota bacterium]
MEKLRLFRGAMMGIAILLVAFPSITFSTPWTEGNEVTISLSNWVNSDPMNKWDDIGGYGGLFTVTNKTLGVSINTFCVELDEYVSLGPPYYVADVSDDVAWAGGRNTNSGDPLSDATKWLYYQYLSGNSSYQNVQALQLAIWYLEEEYSDKTNFDWSYWGETGTTASGYVANSSGQTTTADIRALDLRNASGGQVQSYLIMVPEPTTLIMLGVGLLGFGIFARRFSRKTI